MALNGNFRLLIGAVAALATFLGGVSGYVYRSGRDAMRLDRVEQQVEAHASDHGKFYVSLAEIQMTMRYVAANMAKLEGQVDRLVEQRGRR